MERGRAIRTEDRVRRAHIEIDVRVVVRCGSADARELLDPDSNFQHAPVVIELGTTVIHHRAPLTRSR